METKYAFFDVDCFERAECGCGLELRPRVVPIGEKLKALYAHAEEKSVRIVFTTCCAGRMTTDENAEDALYIPLNAVDTRWIERLPSSRKIYLAKTAYGTPEEDIKHVAWDMFLHNGNATRLFQELNIPDWIVFGNGMDLCVSSAARGILKAGFRVSLLSDVMISSAGGTPESMEKTINKLCEAGATRETLQSCLARLA